jgi:tripartite-type tricarboxylate transporter receptor subunit TctC
VKHAPALTAAIALLAAGSVAAQDYPIRTIRMIVPFAAGGGTDVLGRIAAQKLSERWGQSVVVENRSGGGGNIGAELVAKATPDGYTLLMAGVPHAISMSLYSKLSYDLARDLVAVAPVGTFPSMIVVHPALPVKSIKDLVALAKRRPGELSFGSGGNGSPNHLALELVGTMAGVRMQHIPYKGSGQLIGDLLGGQVQLASMGFPTASAHVKTGKLRALAVTGGARSPLFPELPTVAEAGLPGFEVSSWYGVFAPPGTPPAIVNKLNTELAGQMVLPDVKERLATLGADPSVMTPDQYAQFVRQEIAKWAKVVKASGARVD